MKRKGEDLHHRCQQADDLLTHTHTQCECLGQVKAVVSLSKVYNDDPLHSSTHNQTHTQPNTSYTLSCPHRHTHTHTHTHTDLPLPHTTPHQLRTAMHHSPLPTHTLSHTQPHIISQPPTHTRAHTHIDTHKIDPSTFRGFFPVTGCCLEHSGDNGGEVLVGGAHRRAR